MIEIRDIKKKYGRCPVLNGVSLTIERGSCVGIIGSNGSGKSTLLEILAGVIRPDTGAFLVDEKLAWAKQVRKKIGYVPQANPLMEELTAWDNICLWNEKADLKQALGEDGALHMLGVDQYLKKPIYKMSGGMKKRVSIASALISKPEILLLDEPSAALDLEGKERLYDYFSRYTQAGGTVIIVTHDIHELEICSHTWILRDGKAMPYIYQGDIHELVGALEG